MLSPGKWYEKVPKKRQENLSFRKWLLGRCKANTRYRNGIQEACSKDILFYLNSFALTYDPRLIDRGMSPLLPFITWPYQDRAFNVILECIEQGQDLVIEKSRDMGASWMSLVAMEWLWHYKEGVSFLMVSRKEDLVDAPGDPDSLFWKVDFVHRFLPEWLIPDMDRRKLHFGNLTLGGTIDGESTTAAAGVGGRRTAMFIDEFSRIEEGYQLLAGTADTTRCRIFNFTPWGTSNAAYKLARRQDVRKLRLHWSEHPEKAVGLYQYRDSLGRVEALDKTYHFPADFNFVMDGKLRSPWYDGECRRRANDREVAQMLDIDYQGSTYQFFDRTLITDLQRTYAEEPYWEGDISYDHDTAKPQGLVKTVGGPLRLWCNLTSEGKPPLASYGAGADICSGTGATNSCMTMTDSRTGQKVAEYATPFLKPDKFAMVAVAICRLFTDGHGEPALFAWEMQGPGVPFGRRVIELGYRNIYFRVSEQKLAPTAKADTPGWFPSQDNKRVLLEEYRSALSSRQFINPSFVALEECLAFIHTKEGNVAHSEEMDAEDPSGAGRNHGDRVVADALSWKMCKRLGTGKPPERGQESQTGSLAWRRRYNEGRRKEEESWA